MIRRADKSWQLRFILLSFLPLACFGQTATNVVLSSSANPSVYGQQVIFSAAVTPAAAPGKITFYDGGTVLGTATLSNGSARLPIIPPATGARTLTARYFGNGSSTLSAALIQAVNARTSGALTPDKPIAYAPLITNAYTVADFDGDGRLDIATGSSILLGNGDGTFRSSPLNPSGGVGMATGDFNGDGKADLVTISYGIGDLVLLLGNGDGTFQAPLKILSGVSNVVIGDFNNDGVPDVAVSPLYPSNVEVLLGNGDGTFRTTMTLVPGGQRDFVTGDFDGDGNIDIVTSSGTVYFGVGDGTFRPTGQSVAGALLPSAQSISVTAGDLNHDGRLDLVLYQGAELYVFPGNGDGTFGKPFELPAPPGGSFIGTLAIGDFDGDGKTDIALDTGGAAIYVYIGRGDSTFRGAVPFSVDLVPFDDVQSHRITAGEFNGDGLTDLVVTRGNAKPEILLLFGQTGNFPTAMDVQLPGATSGILYTATLAAGGGPTPYSWSLCCGAPPYGIQLTPGGALTGVPDMADTAETFAFSGLVSGPGGPGFYSGLNASINLTSPLLITNVAHFVPVQGLPTGYALTATGGVPPYKGWQVISGALPSGLTVDAVTGLISGTAVSTGTYRFTLSVTDSAGLTSLPRQVTLEVAGPLSIANPQLPDGFTGIPYYYVLKGNGGVTIDAYQYLGWSVQSGSLPPGLTLDSVTGVISGVPTSAAGTSYPFTVVFNNSYPGTSPAPQALSISIGSAGTVGITLTSSANPSVLGEPITLTAHLTGATRPGRVTFYDGPVPLSAAAVAGGQASLTVTLGAGKHALSARFFLPPASAFLSQTVRAVAVGSFRPSAGYGTPAVTHSNATAFVADFNGDGKPDLATSSYVLLGNGDGTFSTLNAPGYILAVADFDEDGLPDVLAAPDFFGGALQVLKGQGDGTFVSYLGEGSIPNVAGSYRQLTVADFNNDGHVDVLADTYLYLGVGDGTFRPAISLNFLVGANGFIGPVAVGDFNDDGVPDIARLDTGGYLTGGYFVAVYFGMGQGAFQPAVPYPATAGMTAPTLGSFMLVAADLDGDGVLDLVLSGPNPTLFSVLLGRGDGTFRPVADYPAPPNHPTGITVSDFNGDTVPDLVFSSASSYYGSGPIAVVTGIGGGAFAGTSLAVPVPPLTESYQPLVADFDGDGRPDIVESVADGTVRILLANHDAPGRLTASPGNFSARAVWPGDFHKTVTVTLTYQTSEAFPPTFIASVPAGTDFVSFQSASGSMTLTYFDGAVYTYSASVNVILSAGAESGLHSATLAFYVGASSVFIPASLMVNPVTAGEVTGVINAAAAGQSLNGVVSPGSYVAIYGSGLAGVGNPSTTSLPLPTTLNGAGLSWGVQVPLLYASASQINALVPFNSGGFYNPLDVVSPTGTIAAYLSVVELQPGIYTQDESGSGPGVIANAFTGQLIDTTHPAHASDYIVVYCTGLGAVTGPHGEAAPGDGAAAPLNTIYHTIAQVTATVGGVSAPVLFSGLTPTFAGLYQVNIQLPPGAGSGAVPLVLKAEDISTSNVANSNLVTIQLQ